MEKWARALYTPCIPLGDNRSKITGSKRHIALSREAAIEGTVLLKNDHHILPLKPGTKIAIFGKGQIDYIKGGGGSGDVHTEYVRNIYEGFQLRADKVTVFHPLSAYYQEYVRQQYQNGAEPGMFDEASVPVELLARAREFTDTAIIVLNRFSGEDFDRKNDGTDAYFYLSQAENAMVNAVTSNFSHVIVLLNVGAMVDSTWFAGNDRISAAVMLWQGGMEGGAVAADIVTGDAVPSGKLVDTCACAFEDYPSSRDFHKSKDYVEYSEDIFVGYRYFETVPKKKSRVIYPFGYGLSYTEFALSDISACCVSEQIVVSATVTNIGHTCGKEVVQVYFGAPAGKLEKPARVLSGFAKTELLQPGESQVLQITYAVTDMASYDDIGCIKRSCYVLEKGNYSIFVGTDVRNATEISFAYPVEQTRIVKHLTPYCTPEKLTKRMKADGAYAQVKTISATRRPFPCDYVCADKPATEHTLADVYWGHTDLDTFLAQLTPEELIHLLGGQPNTGVANTYGMGDLDKYGIPSVMTADGPAGVRIERETGVCTTAFPIATALACTWNLELVEDVGRACALECKENNLMIWLAPALNIHRSPLCGRNFEYFSEDPLISGKMAAAIVRGVQSQKIVACPKHFACNNKETNRFESDSILSERALREIYLKGFEICIKEAKPKMVMSSYNLINGVRASENGELLTGILRGEWEYDGMVTTDWNNHASHVREVQAGNDIKMPLGQPEKLHAAYVAGELTREELAVCAKRILQMILWLD